MDDEELVRRAQDGDRQAYALLVERYTAKIYAYCRAHVWRHDAVPDLVQETFLRGWKDIKSLKAPDRFPQWLVGIAHNVCSSWSRDERRRRETLSADLDTPPDPLAPEPPVREDVDDLMSEVRRLPLVLRTVMLLHLMSPRSSYEQLAGLLDVSREEINRRLTRARSWLRRRLLPRPGRGELEHAMRLIRALVEASGCARFTPPTEVSQAVLKELVRRGKIKQTAPGTYALAEERPGPPCPRPCPSSK